jgi:hypothetical protein
MSSIPSSGGTGFGNTSSVSPAPRLVIVAILVGVVICVMGGFVTGYLLTLHSILGIALLGIGGLVGFLSRKITVGPSRVAAQCLVAACALSFCLAMVSWYRWGLTLPDDKGGRRDPTWQEALTRAPQLLWQFQAPNTLLISGICAAFGAAEAFRQAGRRYRLVAVVEE